MDCTALLLGHLKTHQENEELYRTFADLILQNIRRKHYESPVFDALISIAIDGSKIPTSIEALIESIHARVIVTNTRTVNIVLALAILLGRVDVAFLPKALNTIGINTTTYKLLLKMYRENLVDMLASIIKSFGWESMALCALFQLTPRTNLVSDVFEGIALHVRCTDDLLKLLLSLEQHVPDISIDYLLCAHDHLRKYHYPADCTRVFSRLLARCPYDDQSRWAWANFFKYFRSFFDCDGLEDLCLTNVFTIFDALLERQNPETAEILAVVNIMIQRNPSLVKPEIIDLSAALVSRSIGLHQSGMLSIWRSICKASNHNISAIGHFLDALSNNHSIITLLLDPLLVKILDPRNIHLMQTFGTRALDTVNRSINAGFFELESNSQVPNDLLEQIHFSLMVLLKLPFSSINLCQITFAKENYSLICRTTALTILYQVARGLKDWNRVMSEFSPLAPWLLHGKSTHHLQILPICYSLWLTYGLNPCKITKQKLKEDYAAILLAVALQARVQNDLESFQSIYCALFDADPSSLVKIKTYLDCIPEQKRQAILDCTVIKGAKLYLEQSSKSVFVIDLLNDLHTLNISITPSLFTALITRIKTDPSGFQVLFPLVQFVTADQYLIDQFDLLIEHFLLASPLKAFQVNSDFNLMEFVIRRLTAVFFGASRRARLYNSPNLRGLLRALLHSLSLSSLESYVSDLLSIDALDDLGDGFITFVCYSCLKRPDLISAQTTRQILQYLYPNFTSFDLINYCLNEETLNETNDRTLNMIVSRQIEDNPKAEEIAATALSLLLKRGNPFVNVAFQLLEHLDIKETNLAEAGLFDMCKMYHPLFEYPIL